jgi:pyruvate dehydrogenase E2 component (dihydrolipoamide acetyltransferase)
VTELEAFRVAINAEQKDVKVTMLALMIKASVAALKKFPDGQQLARRRRARAQAVLQHRLRGRHAERARRSGRRNADKKGVLDIARETSATLEEARDGKLGMGDMTGATFTISSLGGIGGTYFTPIINAPEVAILGAQPRGDETGLGRQGLRAAH